jgi:hypothetical protein
VFTSSCTHCIPKKLVSKILSGKYCSVTTDSLKHVACRQSVCIPFDIREVEVWKFEEKTSYTG